MSNMDIKMPPLQAEAAVPGGRSSHFKSKIVPPCLGLRGKEGRFDWSWAPNTEDACLGGGGSALGWGGTRGAWV